MIPPRMNVVTLGIRDLPKMKAFYEALGWTAQQYDDDFVRLHLGGGSVTMFKLPLLAEEANLPVAEETGVLKGFTLAVAVGSRDEVDPAFAVAKTAGARVLAEPQERDFGGYSGYFADPEGNAWEIVWIPGATFDDGGALIWPS